MNIAILGYGRMGKEVEKQAIANGHRITAIYDINDSFNQKSDLDNAHVIISFTLAESVLENIKTAAYLGVPIVEGTTGWQNQLDELKKIENISIIYSPNFSIGVYQFSKIVEYAATLLGEFKEYDCYLHEWHHAEKVDSPSGTAKNLAKILVNNLPEKNNTLFEASHGKIKKNTLHVTSTRVGRIPGTHEIGFDSPSDSITLRHTAFGREGFAIGAVKAAEWIKDKKGIFTMNDFMRSISHY